MRGGYSFGALLGLVFVVSAGFAWLAASSPVYDGSAWARECRSTCAERGVMSMTATECRCGVCP